MQENGLKNFAIQSVSKKEYRLFRLSTFWIGIEIGLFIVNDLLIVVCLFQLQCKEKTFS